MLVGLLAALAVTAPLGAQSLLDNQYYHKAQDLLTQSQQAYDQGDYDQATSLANQAKDQLAQSDAYIAELTKFYRANGYLSQANDRVAYAKSINADVHYKDQYDKAVTDVTGAKTALDGKDYDTSVGLSKDALAVLADIAPVVAAKPPEPQPAQPAASPGALPQYYTVRLIPDLRDCFWRIAGYPFVYNDPWKWRALWEANKNVLTDPNNANLILPGQVFTIPSVAGEKREGMYDPEQTYPEMPARQ